MIFTHLKKTIASKSGWKKLCRKSKKTDGLQPIANLADFCACMIIAFRDGNSLARWFSMRCIWQNYGHIDENGSSVRKCPAPKKAITDKMGKNGRLSVNLSEILDRLVEQHCIKKAGQKQSQIDRLRSAFRLINCLFFEL